MAKGGTYDFRLIADIGMRTSLASLLLIVLTLSGCATKPTQLSRDEWISTTTRVYRDHSKEDVIRAGERLLRLAGGDGFQIQHSEEGLYATRNWLVYIVIAAATGVDYWKLLVTQTPDGAKASLQVSTQAQPIAPMLTAGPEKGTGWTAMTGPMAGSPVNGTALYDLFWSRIDYLLGKRKDWMTCAESDKRVKSKTVWGTNEALCNSFNVADAHPER